MGKNTAKSFTDRLEDLLEVANGVVAELSNRVKVAAPECKSDIGSFGASASSDAITIRYGTFHYLIDELQPVLLCEDIDLMLSGDDQRLLNYYSTSNKQVSKRETSFAEVTSGLVVAVLVAHELSHVVNCHSRVRNPRIDDNAETRNLAHALNETCLPALEFHADLTAVMWVLDSAIHIPSTFGPSFESAWSSTDFNARKKAQSICLALSALGKTYGSPVTNKKSTHPNPAFRYEALLRASRAYLSEQASEMFDLFNSIIIPSSRYIESWVRPSARSFCAPAWRELGEADRTDSIAEIERQWLRLEPFLQMDSDKLGRQLSFQDQMQKWGSFLQWSSLPLFDELSSQSCPT